MDYIVKTFGTGCDEVVGTINVVVTRPDGIVDMIGCICIDEAKKYMRRYNERGWNAYIKIITTDCGE